MHDEQTHKFAFVELSRRVTGTRHTILFVWLSKPAELFSRIRDDRVTC